MMQWFAEKAGQKAAQRDADDNRVHFQLRIPLPSSIYRVPISSTSSHQASLTAFWYS